MHASWRRLALLVAVVGYVTVLVVFPPVDAPTVVVFSLVPLVVAGSLFGLNTALAVMAGLLVVTGAVLASTT